MLSVLSAYVPMLCRAIGLCLSVLSDAPCTPSSAHRRGRRTTSLRELGEMAQRARKESSKSEEEGSKSGAEESVGA